MIDLTEYISNNKVIESIKERIKNNRLSHAILVYGGDEVSEMLFLSMYHSP
ncbi:MAG: hypothetical protein KBT46_02460 [Ruminococcus sp.]|nr:hypothetical protein [Candidatus Copronaster equi]